MSHYQQPLIFLASFSVAFILLTTFALAALVDLGIDPVKPGDWRGLLLAPCIVTMSHIGILFGASTWLTKGSDVSQSGRLGLLVAVVDWAIIIMLLAGVMTIEKMGHGGYWELLAIFLIVFFVGPVLAIVLVTLISQLAKTK
jgi:hypothetical protein